MSVRVSLFSKQNIRHTASSLWGDLRVEVWKPWSDVVLWRWSLGLSVHLLCKNFHWILQLLPLMSFEGTIAISLKIELNPCYHSSYTWIHPWQQFRQPRHRLQFLSITFFLEKNRTRKKQMMGQMRWNQKRRRGEDKCEEGKREEKTQSSLDLALWDFKEYYKLRRCQAVPMIHLLSC